MADITASVVDDFVNLTLSWDDFGGDGSVHTKFYWSGEIPTPPVDNYYCYGYWAYEVVALTGGIISSGIYYPIIIFSEDLVEPTFQLLGAIQSGAMPEIVVHAPATLEEPAMKLTGGIINQGKWWDPLVEPEPVWD